MVRRGEVLGMLGANADTQKNQGLQVAVVPIEHVMRLRDFSRRR